MQHIPIFMVLIMLKLDTVQSLRRRVGLCFPPRTITMVIIADHSTQFLKLPEAEKSASNPTHLFSILYEEVSRAYQEKICNTSQNMQAQKLIIRQLVMGAFKIKDVLKLRNCSQIFAPPHPGWENFF